MEMLSPPKSLNLNGDLAVNWKKWKQSLELYMIASGANDREERVKVALLLHIIGEEALDLYNTFDLTEQEKNSYAAILQKFENYCVPRANTSVEAYKFNNRVQGPDESFDNFVSDLRKISSMCDFGNLRDRLIMDRIVQGVKDHQVKLRLLAEQNLTLARAVEIGKAAEQARVQMKTINNEAGVETVAAKVKENQTQRGSFRGRGHYGRGGRGRNGAQERLQDNRNKQQVSHFRRGGRGSCSTSNFEQKTCYRCGYGYSIGHNCPAIGKTCKNCKKSNHFASVCKNKTVNEVLESDSTVFLGSLNATVNVLENDWFQKLNLVDCNCEYNFKLDTGAQVNLLTSSIVKELGLQHIIKPSNVTLTSFAGNNLAVVGKIALRCALGSRLVWLDFEVVNLKNTAPILGLPGIQKLEILKRNENVSEVLNVNIFQKDKELFEGVGDIKMHPSEIKLKEGAEPKTVPCRKIPFKLQDKVKAELKKLENLNIIAKIDEPTEWVNPIVIVNKPHGEIRPCLDPLYLNKAVLRQYYKLPSFEEVVAEIHGATIFSKLDANKGFYQIRLSDESSKLTTFITPQGRYRFLRLPFGLSSAPEIFHSVFNKIFGDIPGVKIYIDDILITGKTESEHNERLKMVLSRAKEMGVRFNKQKCKIGLKEVRFMGHIFSEEGVKIDADRVEAIRKIPEPKNSKELARFLGMVTYVSKFIPNLAEKTANLRNLCKKNTQWDWSLQCSRDFEILKDLLMKTPVLQYFDVSKPIVLSVDSSKDGLGAVILQNGGPVVYASKSLTDCQKSYAQIEKEMLAICFGCERFHQYVYGQRVVVETDHKPLESIFLKPLEKCPLRLQRMRTKLQCYDIIVKYKPGSKLYVADTLSRASYDDKNFEFENELETHIDLIDVSYNVTDSKLEEIKRETENDSELKDLLNIIKIGWPESKKEVLESVREYWHVRDELVECKGLIVKGQQIVIPKKLRKEMLEKIHVNHLGRDKSILRAKECLYWPRMEKEISDKVGSCNICSERALSNSNEPMCSRELPNRPWQIIAMDMLYLEGHEYLLVVDTYSKFPEIMILKNQTSYEIINCLKAIFSRHGIPQLVYSDNGTNFVSQEMKNFAKQWKFSLKTSTPQYPQSNGFIERHVQTVKNVLIKANRDRKDMYLMLLELRNTPISNNMKSPAQLLYNRRLNGILPMKDELLKTGNNTSINKELIERQQRQKHYYNRQRVKELKPLQIGDRVLLQLNKRNWKRGVVIRIEKDKPRAYTVKLNDGRVFSRNRKFINLDKGSEETFREMLERNLENSEVINYSRQIENCNDSDMRIDRDNDREEENVPNYVKTTRLGRVIKRPSYLSDYL